MTKAFFPTASNTKCLETNLFCLLTPLVHTSTSFFFSNHLIISPKFFLMVLLSCPKVLFWQDSTGSSCPSAFPPRTEYWFFLSSFGFFYWDTLRFQTHSYRTYHHISFAKTAHKTNKNLHFFLFPIHLIFQFKWKIFPVQKFLQKLMIAIKLNTKAKPVTTHRTLNTHSLSLKDIFFDSFAIGEFSSVWVR